MEQTTVIRVATPTAVIFSILFLPLLLWGGSAIWSAAHVERGVLLCVGYLLAVYWVCSPTIELAPGRLAYATLFTRRDIDLATVCSVRAGADPAPTLRFFQQNGRVALKFRIKPFSKSGLVVTLRHVLSANSSVELDTETEHMSTGDFAPITREAVSTRNLVRVAMMVGTTTLGAALIKLLLHRHG